MKIVRVEDFPVDIKQLAKLISVFNTKNKKTKEKKSYVYVNLSMVRLQTFWIIPKILYGMGVADSEDMPMVAVTWGKNEHLTELLRSMGVEHYCIEEKDWKNPTSAVKAILKAFWVCVVKGKATDLKKMSTLGLPAGRAIYEDILRTSELSTIRNARNIVCFKKTFHILWMIYAMNDWMKIHPPFFWVADDIAYHEGIQSALAYRKGAKVYAMNVIGDAEVLFDEQYRTVRWGEIKSKIYHEKTGSLDDDCVGQSEQLLQQRFMGKNGRDIDKEAYKGKNTINRLEAIEKLNLDQKKKNIIIMAHTFTDAVFNYGDYFYRDYYDWLEETLKIADKVDTVNWILKPHPTRASYHESRDSIEAMYRRHKKNHIFLLPDSISAESIKNIADAILTIGGNAGGEYSCFGIPTIILGKPYYSGFGYTIEPKTRREYENILYHIHRIKPLSEKQVELAKKVFYLGNTPGNIPKGYKDSLSSMIYYQDQRMSEERARKLFENNDGTQKYNDEIIDKLVDYFESHDFSDCEYYQRGRARALE